MNISTVVKRLRGTIGTVVMWSITWAVAGVLLRIVLPLEGNAPSLRMLYNGALHWSVVGAVAGAVFSLCLAYEDRQSISQLSMRRMAVWGTFSGLAIPLGTTLGEFAVKMPDVGLSIWGLLAEYGAVGCLCAVASVAIARAASKEDDSTLSEQNAVPELRWGTQESRDSMSASEGVVREAVSVRSTS